jgi:hypothetical protein
MVVCCMALMELKLRALDSNMGVPAPEAKRRNVSVSGHVSHFSD